MERLKASLKKTIERNKEANLQIKSDDEYFLEEFTKVNLKGSKKAANEDILPKFYSGLPAETDELKQKLREEARAQFLQRRSRSLLDNEELKKLYSILEAQSVPPEEEFSSLCEDNLLNYEQFLKAKEESSDKCQQYFKAITFAKLQHGDPHGRISVMAFFNYVMRKVWIHQTRIGLSLYDVNGQGFLREQDVENYIAELIETLPQLDGLDKSFHSFYVCTAVRKFFFFLDPLRTGKIRILDILACSFLDDLLELRDQDLAKDVQDANWFSAPSALRVYGQYLNLDKDHNGMLSRQELLSYGTSTLTPTFVDRVFEECLTYGGEMDYKTYLDFVLALENRKEPQALNYFFKILDVKHQGFLNTFCLNYFFRDILQQMEKLSQDPVRFEDVKDEIFDMVRPEDPLRIKLEDLIRCCNGDTVVSILIDLNGFWNYENREVLASDNNSEDTTSES
eukprot:11439.XXX_267153_265527_1 [CDS] Oithona nana genome sequencing.